MAEIQMMPGTQTTPGMETMPGIELMAGIQTMTMLLTFKCLLLLPGSKIVQRITRDLRCLLSPELQIWGECGIVGC